MPKHGSLSLKTFVPVISWDLFQRYFDGLLPDSQPSPWAFLNEDVMEQFLGDPQNAEANGAIMEDFQRIKDIAAEGMNLIVLAYNRTGAPFDQEQSVQELAMRLFLDHPDAFQFAWSRYLFFGAVSKLNSYPIDMPPLNITNEMVERFRADLQQWFSRLAKGNQCRVNWFRDQGQTMLHIQRGSYVRTIARWKDDRIEIETFLPVSEDLMIYDSEQSDLTINVIETLHGSLREVCLNQGQLIAVRLRVQL